MSPNPQETADLVTFTEVILIIEKFIFLCSDNNDDSNDDDNENSDVGCDNCNDDDQALNAPIT